MFNFNAFRKKDVGSDLVTKSYYNNYTADFSLFLSNKGQADALAASHIQQIILNYQTIAPLNSAVNIIARAVGGLPIAIKNKDNDEIITEHPALELLDSPNKEEQKTKKSFFKQMTIWKIIEGDIYLEATGNINKPPLELFILKPQFMNIDTDSKGFPDIYRFNSNVFNRFFRKNQVSGRIFGVENPSELELLHIKNFNPRAANDCPTGMSEVLPLYFEINQYLKCSNHNLNLLDNSATPSGALVIKNGDRVINLTEEQVSRLKRQFEDCYQSSNNAGRPLVLEGGMEWQQMSLSPKDMDFQNLKKNAEKQIYINLGIPLPILTDDASTFNNKSEARLEFYEDRVFGIAEDILSALTDFLLINRYKKPNLEFIINKNEVDALSIKRASKIELVNNNAVLTLNEKRAKLGQPPILGGDQVFTASGMAIAGDIE